MSKVFLHLSMSLDGFIAGLHDGSDNPMGDGGLRLHQWFGMGAGVREKSEGNTAPLSTDMNNADQEVFNELFATTGAIITGRRTYDITNGWGGTHPVHAAPVFVLSKDVPEKIPQGKSTFTFVTDGIESAVAQAKKAAGAKDVYVMGGANVAQQCIKAGLLDEIRLDVVPVLFGEGIRLFDHIGNKHIELKKIHVVDGADALHLKLQVMK